MPDDAVKRPPANWVRSPNGVFDVYVNASHMTWTVDDIRIRLGQFVASAEHANPGTDYRAVVEERAGVTFTWRAAVLLRDQLAQIIHEFEKENGPIQTGVKIPKAPF